MAVNPNTTVRKNVSLPRELADRIERFRTSRGLASESDALRRLVEIGLGSIDTPEELAERCENATRAGHGFSYIIANILEDHPLVASMNINSDVLIVYLRSEDELRFQKNSRQWLMNGKPIPIPF